METSNDLKRRRLVQAVGCLSYVIGAGAVAALAMMIWRIV